MFATLKLAQMGIMNPTRILSIRNVFIQNTILEKLQPFKVLWYLQTCIQTTSFHTLIQYQHKIRFQKLDFLRTHNQYPQKGFGLRVPLKIKTLSAHLITLELIVAACWLEKQPERNLISGVRAPFTDLCKEIRVHVRR